MTIWKFPLRHENRQYIEVPNGTVFLRCQYQRDELQLWGIVDEGAKIITRAVWIIGTGRPVPTHVPLTFIDTVQQPGYALVWHIFVETK